MSVLNENQLLGASAAGGEFEIEQSLRLNIDTPKWIKRTPSSDSNRKTWTLSIWHKRGAVGRNLTEILFKGGGSGGSGIIAMHLTNSSYGDQDKIWLSFDGATTSNPVTNRVFRDPSGWMHIVLRFDTTQSTVTDRARLYINGELIISTDYTFLWSTSWAGITQNSDWNVNKSGIEHSFGAHQTNQPLDGYLADISFVDGQSLGPDSFGETGDYGEWKPIDVSGLTFGTNGYHLDFADSSALGNDANGSNNFTTVGIAATDQMVDSPTNNFATLNPLSKDSSVILQEGNLLFYRAANMTRPALSTIGLGSTQKWYCEFHERSGTNIYAGVQWEGTNVNTYPHAVGTYAYIANADGGFYQNGSYTSFNSPMTSGDKIRSIAYDAATGKMWIGANGTFSGNPAAGSGELLTVPSAYRHQMYFVGAKDNASATTAGIANFGQDSSFAGNKTAQGNQDANSVGDFYYAPPTGYLALCTSNLPDVDVIPSEHFNTVLYTGNGSTQSITGVGLKPDFVWWKSRNGSNSNVQNDSVRGVELMLRSNLTNAESTGDLTSFDSDGFSVRNTVDNGNYNGETYVAWNWKAGGSASTITTGTIDSVVSANPSAGFSIVKYVGNNTANATIAHGLSQTPTFIITKNMTNSAYWATYLFNDANKKYYMNASSSDAATWITPAAALITLVQTNANNINESGSSYINYCFHSVDGYSRVGEYTGNGNSDGTFVNCGFRPKYVLIRRNLDAFWNIFDTERGPYNVIDNVLWANGGDAENVSSNWNIDLLSNGFKQRSTHDYMNDNGETFFFIAFAETPFKFSNAR